MSLRLRHCLTVWVIFGLGFVAPAMQKTTDPDIWWHIKTGEIIRATHSVPTQDPFSFTSAGQPWVAHEWLSEVIFYGVFSTSGLLGIIILRAVLLTLMFAGVFHLVRARTVSWTASLAITAVCGVAGWQLWSPRPQLFTYLLLIGLLLILRKPVTSRWMWSLVPLFWLWSNLHGAWLFGFVVMLTVLTDSAVRLVRAGKSTAVLRLGAVCIACILAVLAGPSPLQRLVYPLSYFTGTVPTAYITDFRSPDFWDPMTIPYEILLLALAPILYLGRKPMAVWEWVILLLVTHMSLTSTRHIPLFSIITAPILATQVQAAIERYAGRMGKQRVFMEKPESLVMNLVLVLILPALLWLRIPRVNDEAHCVVAGRFPCAAGRFLADHPRLGDGRLLNTYNWGGYLIFHLYPKYRVSLDGRADVHHRTVRRELRNLEYLSPDWRAELGRLDPDVILWPAKEPLTALLRHEPAWKVLYEDGLAVVFARRDRPAVSGTVADSR